MKVFRTQKELKSYLNSHTTTIKGFVPTMGALHKGHLSLIRQAKIESDIVICSIFVNPTQFNDLKDFEKYPSTHESDIDLLVKEGCDILYLPESVDDVYLYEEPINIELGRIAEVMEGANRPGHFDGVMQVVKILFDIVTPNKAFFGLKDFQQYSVIKKMVTELGLNIEIVGCPIVREANGLAMSSRNTLLNEKEQLNALVISETLQFLQEKSKEGPVVNLLTKCKEKLNSKSDLEYLVIADVNSLETVEILEKNKEYRAFVVSHIGNVRLIDNIEIFI
jgi:pantoate--beta-alanine ligase